MRILDFIRRKLHRLQPRPGDATRVRCCDNDEANWGKGYGHEALELALGFAFRELNLYRVQLTVFGYNERAIALYKTAGFQREGVYREFMQRDGQRYDLHLFGLLRREWEALNREMP
ncbi:MAG: GNAT family N-acetyltransferase [Ardenticatenaceae bacterium]|nr:GNAT family N-acetyltransferase [Ardenticatenaceae bacterium]